MAHKLRSLFRISSRRSKRVQPGTAEKRSETAASTNIQTTTSRIGNERQADPSVESSSATSESRRLSLSVPDAPPIIVTDYAHPKSENIDSSVADDYKAYFPVMEDALTPAGPEYMSVGGDRRLIMGRNQLKHSEDVADRNVDMYGVLRELSPSPQQSDIETTRENFGESLFSFYHHLCWIMEFGSSLDRRRRRARPVTAERL